MQKEIILITGATRGLGLASAEALAKQGYQVILTGRDPQMIAQLNERFNDTELAINTQLLDVADDQSVNQAKAEVEERFGKLDCLLNNAGVICHGCLPRLGENRYGWSDCHARHPARYRRNSSGREYTRIRTKRKIFSRWWRN